MDLILPILIGIVAIYVLFKLLAFLKKKGLLKFDKKDKTKKPKQKKERKAVDVTGAVSLVDKYMYRREVKALIALNRVLPKEFIALPKVGVANLVEPKGSRNLYNSIKDFFVDFVIFEEATMKPKLIVDVYDNSFEDELLKQKHPQLVEIMKNLNINILEIAVRGEIDLNLLQELINKHLEILEEKSEK